MKYLLDTHVLLWWLFDDPKLSQAAKKTLADPDNTLLVSAASAWEISTKYRIGKLPAAETLVKDIPGWIGRAGFRQLSISLDHAQQAGSWPQAHRDPFDRMLAAQSLIEASPLISRDPEFEKFEISVVW